MELDIRYARSGGAAIAHQVVGSGPTDLVFVPEFMSNLVYGWETPRWRQFYERLGSFSRLIRLERMMRNAWRGRFSRSRSAARSPAVAGR